MLATGAAADPLNNHHHFREGADMGGDRRDLLRIVNSVAPMRICDNGGWTDTWFACQGRIFNIAVQPYAQVQMRVRRAQAGPSRITIHAENYGQRYVRDVPEGTYLKHPLLEAAIDYMRIPPGLSLEFSVYSECPSGCSTGTSAAVSVAMIGALDRLTHRWMTPHEVAMAAHRIETELLGQQCGIQDQIASAYGGISFIEMHQYPHAMVSQIRLPEPLWWELESRLTLVFVGLSHSSSEVHKKVIARLQREGSSAPVLDRLRRAAEQAKEALYAADLPALGRSMIENTQAQGELHPELVGPGHARIIEIARACGALGWKVNGAGGDGGSVTLLSGADRSGRRAMIRQIEQDNPSFRHIPIYLSAQGLRVWESPVQGEA